MKIFYLILVLVLAFVGHSQTSKQKIVDRTFVEFQMEKTVEINGKLYSIGTNNGSQETYSGLVKQDYNLNVEWLTYVYRGFFIPDKFQRLSHMVKTNDNHMIIAGAYGEYSDASAWIMEVDTNANIIWEKDISSLTFIEARFVIHNDVDGAFIACREPVFPDNAVFYNLDTNGDTLWTRRATSQMGVSLVNREGYMRTSDNAFIHFVHESGQAAHMEISNSGDLLSYTKYAQDITGTALLVNAVYYEPGAAYIAGRLAGSSAVIMKLDDNLNIQWSKMYPELSAFTGIKKVGNGEFIANGINTSGVYNNLATTVRLDANCDPIKGYAYGQIPGYHTIPFHATDLGDHYLFTGYRIEQGWNTGYQIMTDTTLNSGSCYQRTFDVSVQSIDIVQTAATVDYFQMGPSITTYGPGTDAGGFYSASYTDFEINNNIQTSIQTTGDDCGGGCIGVAEATSLGGVSPYSYEWSNGQSGDIATGLCSDDQLVLLTGDQLGCFRYDTIVVPAQAPVTEVCMVTVDQTSTKNIVVWEKPTSLSISGFKVYREVVGNYNVVGYVPYDSLSIFIDNTNGVNPNITSYRYKISTVDTCGNESALSDFHETIHVTQNQGSGNTINLIWDNYEGETFAYNRILRDTTGLGNWEVLDSVAGSVFTWTDQDPPVDSASYMIEILFSSVCTATGKAQDYNSSRSNISTTIGGGGIVGLEEEKDQKIKFYPNPVENMLTIEHDLNEARIIITDASGRLVMETIMSNENKTMIETNELSSGVYLVTILTETGRESARFVKR